MNKSSEYDSLIALTSLFQSFREEHKLTVAQMWSLIVSAHSEAFCLGRSSSAYLHDIDVRSSKSPGITIDDIPMVAKVLVLSYLPLQKRLLCSTVSKAWLYTVSAPDLWTSVDLSWKQRIDDSTIYGLCTHGKYLVSINLSLDPVHRKDMFDRRNYVTFGGWKSLLDRCRYVRHLNISQLHINDSFFPMLLKSKVSKHLETLDISFCNEVTNNAFAKLADVPSLTGLYARNCFLVTDNGVRDVLPHLPNLRKLSLSGNKNIGDTTLRTVGEYCRDLEVLDISTTSITDVGLVALGDNCSMLRKLNVGKCSSVTLGGVDYLLKLCNKIESLNISQIYIPPHASPLAHGAPNIRELILAWCMNITDINMAIMMKGMSNLETLTLEMAQTITDQALRDIALNCPRLKSLDVFRCVKVSDMGMSAILRVCTELTRLNIGACDGVGDATMREIARCSSKLKWLCVFKTRIVDRSVQVVSERCQNLEYLDVSDCQCITDRSLESVARNCRKLETLDITWCQGMTDDALVEFGMQFPKLKVHRHTHQL